MEFPYTVVFLLLRNIMTPSRPGPNSRMVAGSGSPFGGGGELRIPQQDRGTDQPRCGRRIAELAPGHAEADAETFVWSPATEPGAAAVTYELLRGSGANNFVTGTACIGVGSAEPRATDPTLPVLGDVLYYLARAVNDCPGGDGSVGQSSAGEPRPARSCP